MRRQLRAARHALAAQILPHALPQLVLGLQVLLRLRQHAQHAALGVGVGEREWLFVAENACVVEYPMKFVAIDLENEYLRAPSVGFVV